MLFVRPQTTLKPGLVLLATNRTTATHATQGSALVQEENLMIQTRVAMKQT